MAQGRQQFRQRWRQQRLRGYLPEQDGLRIPGKCHSCEPWSDEAWQQMCKHAVLASDTQEASPTPWVGEGADSLSTRRIAGPGVGRWRLGQTVEHHYHSVDTFWLISSRHMVVSNENKY